MPSGPERSTRRSVLTAGVALLTGLAGCSTESTDTDDSSDPTERTSDPTETGPGLTDTASGQSDTPTDSPPPDEGETATNEGTAVTNEGTTTPDLDLREANVVGVEFEGDDGTYRFDVTLYHDDDGEDGYANWWQVESLAGDQLGRRTLLHAHSTDPFTRSETVDVPAGTTCVVVRGHDQTHGYGGQAMVVDVDTGATARVQQGPERQSVSESDCP